MINSYICMEKERERYILYIYVYEVVRDSRESKGLKSSGRLETGLSCEGRGGM